MSRCIELAKNGRYTAAPNPSVGCVIVYKNQIIGEGATSPFGGPHAEVNALQAVEDKSLLADATLYVSLEPCSHFGKTPPCVDSILKHNIPSVVIGVRDPNPLVGGQGIQKLRDAGCSVEEGILENECRNSNIRFFTFYQKKRPYIILKWAQTPDGYIAPSQKLRNADPEPFWISNTYSRQLVHHWRAEEKAVLVGTNTALEDNPRLNLRDWGGDPPLRIVLDRELKIPLDFHLLDLAGETLVLTDVKDESRYKKGVQYRQIDFASNLADQLCSLLWEMNISSLIVEGGSKTLNTFIKSGIWDEARIFTGARSLGEGVKAPRIQGYLKTKEEIGSDNLEILLNDQEYHI